MGRVCLAMKLKINKVVARLFLLFSLSLAILPQYIPAVEAFANCNSVNYSSEQVGDVLDSASSDADVDDNTKMMLILLMGGALVIIIAVVISVVSSVVSSVAAAVDDEEE